MRTPPGRRRPNHRLRSSSGATIGTRRDRRPSVRFRRRSERIERRRHHPRSACFGVVGGRRRSKRAGAQPLRDPCTSGEPHRRRRRRGRGSRRGWWLSGMGVRCERQRCAEPFCGAGLRELMRVLVVPSWHCCGRHRTPLLPVTLLVLENGVAFLPAALDLRAFF